MKVVSIAEYYAEILNKVPATAAITVSSAACEWNGTALRLMGVSITAVPGQFYLSEVRINGLTVSDFFAAHL